MRAANFGRANRRRGEVEAVLDGERRILCLTLGALAELETAFCADDLTGLAERFARPCTHKPGLQIGLILIH